MYVCLVCTVVVVRRVGVVVTAWLQWSHSLSLSLASLLERDLRVASFLVNEYHPLFAAVNEGG